MFTADTISTNHLQPKLQIGQLGDKYEREADAVADQVVMESRQMKPDIDSYRQIGSMGTYNNPKTPEINMQCDECGQEDTIQMKPSHNNIQLMTANPPDDIKGNDNPNSAKNVGNSQKTMAISKINGDSVIQKFSDLETECATRATGRCRPGSEYHQDAQQAVERMSHASEGAQLLDDLRDHHRLQNTRIIARFDTDTANVRQGEMGNFRPDDVLGAPVYWAIVNLHGHAGIETAQPESEESPLPSPQSYYGTGRNRVPTYVVERRSMLSETLYHELLHIWYLNEHGNLGAAAGLQGMYPYTGHGDADLGEIDTGFSRRLIRFARAIYREESRLAREAPQTPIEPQESEQREAPDSLPPIPSPDRENEEEGITGPSPHNFRAGLHLGYLYNHAPTPADEHQFGIGISAGYVYGNALRLGIRGQAMYLPGAGLFSIGSGLNLQYLENDGDNMVSNPLLIDLDLGATYVLPSDSVVISPSAGLGFEYGEPDQWRFYMRAGAGPDIVITPSGGDTVVGGSGSLTLGVTH